MPWWRARNVIRDLQQVLSSVDAAETPRSNWSPGNSRTPPQCRHLPRPARSFAHAVANAIPCRHASVDSAEFQSELLHLIGVRRDQSKLSAKSAGLLIRQAQDSAAAVAYHSALESSANLQVTTHDQIVASRKLKLCATMSRLSPVNAFGHTRFISTG